MYIHIEKEGKKERKKDSDIYIEREKKKKKTDELSSLAFEGTEYDERFTFIST